MANSVAWPHRIDGNIIKRAAGGGDEIQCRTNYQNETQKRLQTTFFLHCNDFPPVEPADALQTLEVFEFNAAYHTKEAIEARGDVCYKHWKEADADIKTKWIPRPDVIDAFTVMVVRAWKSTKLPPPKCVVNHTRDFNAAASIPEIDRVKEVVKYTPSTAVPNVFTDEIKLALDRAGLVGLSTYKIGMYLDRLYGHEVLPPQNIEFRKGGRKGRGFNHITLNDVVAFDAGEVRRAENLTRNEHVRQQARFGFELGKRSYDEMEDS